MLRVDGVVSWAVAVAVSVAACSNDGAKPRVDAAVDANSGGPDGATHGGGTSGVRGTGGSGANGMASSGGARADGVRDASSDGAASTEAGQRDAWGGADAAQRGEGDAQGGGRDASFDGSDGASSDAAPQGPPRIGSVSEPGDPGSVDVVFDVRADRGLHAISPLIYGTNGAADIERTGQSVIRLGGNRLTTYNWENNASNAGNDNAFKSDGLLWSTNEVGRAAANAIDAAWPHGACAILTVPIVDYVAADKNGDVYSSGADYLATRFRKNRARKPSPLSTRPDTTDAFVYQDEFVHWVREERPEACVLYSLDNEPDIWAVTHPEVHPEPVTYAELWDRNVRFAQAIKDVSPDAAVLGFVSYGYNGYISLQEAPDAAGRDFIDWYLEQARARELSSGRRLIDYLDLHWYPEAQGGGQRVSSDDAGEEVVAARVQAPRSLWDDTYTESSWIIEVTGGPIDLLHWLNEKIEAHYPDTRLAFTEWNFGGGNHVSGAVATADVLGIFGREGVGLATYWSLYGEEPFARAAFRIYRNYDGKGAGFGEYSIFASASDAATASVYASVQGRHPEKTIIVAINKAVSVKTAGIRIAQSVAYPLASVWALQGSTAEIVAGESLAAVAHNAFRYEMPPLSVSVLRFLPE